MLRVDGSGDGGWGEGVADGEEAEDADAGVAGWCWGGAAWPEGEEGVVVFPDVVGC